MWAWTLLLCGFVLYPTYTGAGDGLVPIGVAALALGLFSVLHPRLRPTVPAMPVLDDSPEGEGAVGSVVEEPIV